MNQGKALPTSKFDPRTVDLKKSSVQQQIKKLSGLYQLGELLVIWNIKRTHTTKVTIQAENSLRKTQATFLLNVTCKTGIIINYRGKCQS